MIMGLFDVVLSSVLGNVLGSDTPEYQAPSADQYQTELQRSMNPMLLELAKSLISSYNNFEGRLPANQNYFNQNNKTDTTPTGGTNTGYQNFTTANTTTTPAATTTTQTNLNIEKVLANPNIMNALNMDSTQIAGAGYLQYMSAVNYLKSLGLTPESVKTYQQQKSSGTLPTTTAASGTTSTPPAPNRMVANPDVYQQQPSTPSYTKWDGKGMPADGAVYTDPKTGAINVWSEKLQSFVRDNDMKSINDPTIISAYNAAKTEQVNAQNPQNTQGKTTDTPDFMTPTSASDYPGQLTLGTPAEEEYLKQQALERVRSNPYSKDLDLSTQTILDAIKNTNGGASQVENDLVNLLSGRMNSTTNADYRNAIYEASADPLRREAERMQQQNASGLAERGLGMSTVVNDVNSGVQRDLLSTLGDLSNKASVAAEQMRQAQIENAISNQRGLQEVLANRGLTANGQRVNYAQDLATNAAQKQAMDTTNANSLNQLLQQQENRNIFNIQTPYNEYRNRVADNQNKINSLMSIYGGQAAPMSTAASIGNMQYATNANATAAQNQSIANAGSNLVSALVNRSKNTPVTPTVSQVTNLQNAGTNYAKNIIGALI